MDANRIAPAGYCAKILGQDRVVERQRADPSQAHAAGSLVADAIGIGAVGCNRAAPGYQRAVIGSLIPPPKPWATLPQKVLLATVSRLSRT